MIYDKVIISHAQHPNGAFFVEFIRDHNEIKHLDNSWLNIAIKLKNGVLVVGVSKNQLATVVAAADVVKALSFCILDDVFYVLALETLDPPLICVIFFHFNNYFLAEVGEKDRFKIT